MENIGWPLSALGLGIMAFILIILGKFPGISASFGNKKLAIGNAPEKDQNSQGEGPYDFIDCHDSQIDEMMDILFESKSKTEQKITSAQIRSIRELTERFDDLFLEIDVDPLLIEALWSRFSWALYMSAVENHILHHTYQDAGVLRVSDDYLEDKLVPVQEGHRRLSSRAGMPSWGNLSAGISNVMRAALDRFAQIANSEWEHFQGLAEASLKSAGSERIKSRIERMLKGAY